MPIWVRRIRHLVLRGLFGQPSPRITPNMRVVPGLKEEGSFRVERLLVVVRQSVHFDSGNVASIEGKLVAWLGMGETGRGVCYWAGI